MIGRQIEEKEGDESEMLSSQRGRMMCPVCGKKIHQINLPDVKSVVEDRLAWVGFVLVNSFVCFLIDCEHRFADRDITLDNLHEFTAVVTCEFDGQGECTHFEVMEVRVKGDNVENRKDKQKGNEGYLNELFNFSCVLRGHVKDLEKIKDYIVENYVNTGLVTLIRPTYDKKEIYILTDDQWKEYQKLKKKDPTLIGFGFP